MTGKCLIKLSLFTFVALSISLYIEKNASNCVRSFNSSLGAITILSSFYLRQPLISCDPQFWSCIPTRRDTTPAILPLGAKGSRYVDARISRPLLGAKAGRMVVALAPRGKGQKLTLAETASWTALLAPRGKEVRARLRELLTNLQLV